MPANRYEDGNSTEVNRNGVRGQFMNRPTKRGSCSRQLFMGRYKIKSMAGNFQALIN